MPTEHSNRFLISQGGQAGFIDRTGAVVIEPTYDSASNFHDGLAYFQRGDRHGLLNPQGEEVCGFGADIHEVKSCAEGLIPFRRGELWGYLDYNGRVAIPPHYDSAWEFEGGMAVTEARNRRIFIGPTNQHLFERSGTFLGGTFREGLAAISHRQKMGYIDRSGRRVIPFRYLLAQEFSEGLAAVKYIKPTAELGNLPGVAYSDSKSWVAGYIDHQGKEPFENYYYDTSTFSEGLAAVQVTPNDPTGTGLVGRHGYIDRTGTIVIEPRFSAALKFSEGLAGVSTRTKFTAGFTQGYINHSGEVVIRPRFRWVNPFRGGLALVNYKRRDAYINPAGDLVWVADQVRYSR